jgi:hypothetical protein
MSWIRQLSQGSARVALTAAIGSATVAAFQLVSVKDEIAIGQQAQQEIRRETPQDRPRATPVVPKGPAMAVPRGRVRTGR